MKIRFLFLSLTAALLCSSMEAKGAVSGAELRKYRWLPKEWKPLPYLLSAPIDSFLKGKKPVAPVQVAFGDLAKNQALLPAKGEVVGRGVQSVGSAKVEGTWTQTIFHPDGHILYAAGAVLDQLPRDQLLPKVERMEESKSDAIQRAELLSPSFRKSSKRFPIEVFLRKTVTGAFEAYWRMEYVSSDESQVRFLHLSEAGALLEEGEVPTTGVEGRAHVFPAGPKWSSLTEVPLHGLVGDGRLNGVHLRITSALNIEAVSPDFLFFFPENDKRFDMAQVYYAMDQAFRWLKEKTGVEMRDPLDVRLHVGENGVSNAAFYHQNTVYFGAGDGITYKDIVKDPSIVIHESIHAVVDTYVGLPSQGEGGAINEGFADFYAALILKNPRMGESSFLKGPYRRTLEHDMKAYQDFTGSVYRNGSILAATLWDLRPILGDDKLARFAFRMLTRLGKGATFADIVPAMTGASAGFLSAEEQSAVVEVARKRGWAVGT